MKKILPFIGIVLLCLNCQNDDDNQDNSSIPEEETCEMQFDDLGLTESNAFITFTYSGISENVAWTARYSENTVELSYNDYCGDECNSKNIFIFKKLNDCIKYDYSYSVNNEHSTGGYSWIEEYFSEHDFIIQEYLPDERLVGRLVTDNFGINENIDFWIDLTTDDFFIEEVPNYISFQNCMSDLLPFHIDVNNDGTHDFKFTYSQEVVDEFIFENIIPYKRSRINIKANNGDHTILGIYFGGVLSRAGLSNYDLPASTEDFPDEGNEYLSMTHYDFLYENNYPYKQFNFWTSQDGYAFETSNLSDIHYAIKMIVNGEPHYGYINFSILGNDCEIIIHETYLNPTPNEHIVIE
ncbi:hypothetical protein [Hanstruepera marina]|uniref:hypothetical protein n=1 Tax=Hanstruepera marina TaxID=2873265 RepID=UPI001CA7753A|nr:hypothetical protein [Hanstruepera marina]